MLAVAWFSISYYGYQQWFLSRRIVCEIAIELRFNGRSHSRSALRMILPEYLLDCLRILAAGGFVSVGKNHQSVAVFQVLSGFRLEPGGFFPAPIPAAASLSGIHGAH